MLGRDRGKVQTPSFRGKYRMANLASPAHFLTKLVAKASRFLRIQDVGNSSIESSQVR